MTKFVFLQNKVTCGTVFKNAFINESPAFDIMKELLITSWD